MILYFLPMIIFLGLITSYEDLKFGKIRNKWIILALVYTFIVNILLFTYYGLNGDLNTQYYLELFTNLIFSIMVGFGFWYYGIWSAGDGKLFIAFANLIPLSSYSLTYYKWIPSMILLFNLFQISFIYMIIIFLKKLKHIEKKTFKEIFSKIINPKKMLLSILSTFTLVWVIKYILNFFNFSNIIFIFTLALFLNSLIIKKFKDKIYFILISILLIRLVYDKSIYSVEFIKDFIIMVLIWRLINMILIKGLDSLILQLFSDFIKIKELKKGMILSETIEKKKLTIKEVKNLEKQKNVELVGKKGIYYIKKPKSLLQFKSYVDEEPEGLTINQINQINQIGFKHIKISKTIPFAIFVFISVILTILIKGNLLIFIKNLFF